MDANNVQKLPSTGVGAHGAVSSTSINNALSKLYISSVWVGKNYYSNNEIKYATR